MTAQEKILFALKDLLDENLPAILRDLSMEYDDGLELKDLTDTFFFSGSARVPYSVIGIKNGEYSEKDRIIENVVFDVMIDVFVADGRDKWRFECRYTEAVKRLIERNRKSITAWEWVQVRRVTGGQVVLVVVG